MYVKFRIIVFIFFCFLFSACKKDGPLFRVYGSITTINGGNAEIKAIVENEFGNCMTGAVVFVSDSKNSVTIMDYNSNSCCYTAVVDAIEDDIYTITVDSIAIGKNIVITIPHTRLSTKPTILSFSDSNGNTVLSGDSLSKDCASYAAWESCGNDVVYHISIKSPLTTLWSGSSSSTSIDIPPYILKPGIYYLCVTAQKIYGDPYFSSADYYSVSSIDSSNIQFYVE